MFSGRSRAGGSISQKPDGRERPIAVAALEDKACPRARPEDRPKGDGHAAERDPPIPVRGFLGFSYGFRPGRGAQDALDALVVGSTAER